MAIEIKNVSKSFKKDGEDFKVLGDMNLTCEDKEITCILGPSGCGKTTLIRLIAGFEEVDTGEISDNKGIVTGPSKDRGFIFQQYSLFPWLTVSENVSFGLTLHDKEHKKEHQRRVNDYLESVGLLDFKNSYPHELSGGMKQRVAIIRSLINHTPIILMDEPFSAVDVQNRRKLQEQLIGVHKKFDNTIVFITHDVDEAVFLADKIVIMDRNPGRVKEIINVDLPHPRNRKSDEFTALEEKLESLLGVLGE